MMTCEDDGTRLDCKDTRSRKNASSTTRIYECSTCRRRYTTIEVFVERPGYGKSALQQLHEKASAMNKEIAAAIDKFNQSIGAKK